jgi:SAM-dependent methyltransferase
MSIQQHEEFLRRTVYFTETRWPFYELLLSDLRRLSVERGIVMAIERCFDKESRVKPYFTNFTSIEAQSIATYSEWFPLHVPQRPALILIHNLIHHTRDVDGLMADVARILKPEGRLYVFEPTFRELHQEPNHWQHFTPYGMEDLLHRHGLIIEETRRTGDAFEAALYCLDQALEYIPDNGQGWTAFKGGTECFDTFRWKIKAAMQTLSRRPRKGMETNLIRENTSFPTAYSVIGRKPT